MTYLERLKALRAVESEKGVTHTHSKPTEAPFVASVGSPPPHAKNIEPATGSESPAGFETRRGCLLQMLADLLPGQKYAALVDSTSVPGVVILALGIRGALPNGSDATLELSVPGTKFDPFQFIKLMQQLDQPQLLERPSGPVH